jgi:GAF domain/ANTAR domain
VSGGDTEAPIPAQILALRLFRAAVADDELPGTTAMLQRICRAAVAGLTMHGGAVHLVGSDGETGLAASSDAASTTIADLAFTAGEAPSTDAFVRRRPVLVNDLAAESSRWPGYCQLAIDLGVRSAYSLPLQVGGMALGVLDLYDHRPRRLTDADFMLAVALTQLATQELLNGAQPGGEGWDEPLMDHRTEIYQAQGMVMVDLKVGLAEALIRMRAQAFSEGVPLIEVARAILGGATLPAADRDGLS